MHTTKEDWRRHDETQAANGTLHRSGSREWSVAHSLTRNFHYKHLHMYTMGSTLAKVFLLNLYQSTWFTFTSQQGNGCTDFL